MSEKNGIEYQIKQEIPKITKSPNFLEKMNKIKSCEKSTYVIIADFDWTFTRYKTNGIQTLSSYQVIQESPLVSKKLIEGSHDLEKTFRKYENDLKHDFEKRKNCMHEWYTQSLTLLAKENLSKSDLTKIIQNQVDTFHVFFRNGVKKFFEIIEKYEIPVIFLSGGIKEIIEGEIALLIGSEKFNELMNKKLLFLTANYFFYDKDGKTYDFKKPIIYTFNKDEMLNLENEILQKNDSNVIFMGDHLNDVDTIKLVKKNNDIKIGFANYKEDQVPQEYYQTYDVVVKEDGDFSIVNEIVEDICKAHMNC